MLSVKVHLVKVVISVIFNLLLSLGQLEDSRSNTTALFSFILRFMLSCSLWCWWLGLLLLLGSWSSLDNFLGSWLGNLLGRWFCDGRGLLNLVDPSLWTFSLLYLYPGGCLLFGWSSGDRLVVWSRLSDSDLLQLDDVYLIGHFRSLSQRLDGLLYSYRVGAVGGNWAYVGFSGGLSGFNLALSLIECLWR